MRALMLDVDGVLVTGTSRGGHWKDDLAQDIGVDPDALRAHFFQPHWSRIIVGEAPMMPLLQEALAQMGSQVPAERLRDYWFAEDSHIDDRVLSDVARLRAADVTVWLATNQEPERARYLMEALALKDHVDGIVASGLVGVCKPDRDFFVACERKVAASDYVLIDDSPDNVDAARGHGWKAVRWPADRGLFDLVA